MPKKIILAEQDMKDHDLLITLNAKVDGIVTDIRDLKDGVQSRLNDHERRIGTIESDHLAIGGTKTLFNQVSENTEWIRGYKRTWKLIVALCSIIGSLSGFLLDRLMAYLGFK